jgi:hypothetical protein
VRRRTSRRDLDAVISPTRVRRGEATPIASTEEARKDVALARVIGLRAARNCNGTKAERRVWAMELEVAAFIAVAVGVLSILL